MDLVEVPAGFEAIGAVVNSPAVRRCMAEIESVAGYRLPENVTKPFLTFHAFIAADPPPPFLVSLRATPKTKYMADAHVNGILGDVQNAITCVWIHRDNLVNIENAVKTIVETGGVKDALGRVSMGLGNTRRWDAEYQAFVLAVRRCLDYLTRSLAAYFKQEFHSFNDLSRVVAGRQPLMVSQAIANARDRHAEKFNYVLSGGDRKSTRDLISHYRFVGAGGLGLTRDGYLMMGGGEALNPQGGLVVQERLSDVIGRRSDDLLACLSDILNSFVDAARQHDLERAGVLRPLP